MLRVASLARLPLLCVRDRGVFPVLVTALELGLALDNALALAVDPDSIRMFLRRLRRSLSAISLLRNWMLLSSLRLAICLRNL